MRGTNDEMPPPSRKQHAALPTVPVSLLIFLQNHVRMFHWRTDSYSKHRISERLYRDLGPTIDKFVELTIAAQGTAVALPQEIPMTLNALDVRGLIDLLRKARTAMSVKESTFAVLCTENMDLASVRDELLEHMGRAIYLLEKGP